jgi:folate-dependent phosphoribosylglycinamide formyltransferase PurN
VVVDLKKGETTDQVAARVFAAECDLYPKTLKRLFSGELPLKNQEVFRYHYEPK